MKDQDVEEKDGASRGGRGVEEVGGVLGYALGTEADDPGGGGDDE